MKIVNPVLVPVTGCVEARLTRECKRYKSGKRFKKAALFEMTESLEAVFLDGDLRELKLHNVNLHFDILERMLLIQ